MNGFAKGVSVEEKIYAYGLLFIYVPVFIHIQSSILHFLIKLFRIKNNGYWNTFKVVAFHA